ncbi:hypothetical protein A3860_17775 [Niastella vici]|uniref:HTH cro/C1-type domain-containing protein n=1 Tax=Niastella vici TaxID=1703345 RepID=A0A1V9G4P0_9BACT|nr:hypothetical protein [Niastella vici]OQP65514.1 hypothetical protein A3860_17775 [Niastella vici]
MKIINKYETAQKLLENGSIKKFGQLQKKLPYTSLAKDAKINPKRLKRLFNDVGEITVAELHRMAEVLHVDIALLRDITIPEADRKTITKKRKKS